MFDFSSLRFTFYSMSKYFVDTINVGKSGICVRLYNFTLREPELMKLLTADAGPLTLLAVNIANYFDKCRVHGAPST